MTIKTVAYGFTRPVGVFANDKVMIEIELSDTDDEMKALRKAKEIADKFFNECNPQMVNTEPTFVQAVAQKQPQSIEDRFLFLITNAATVSELIMHKPLIENPKYPHLKEAYNKRLQELID